MGIFQHEMSLLTNDSPQAHIVHVLKTVLALCLMILALQGCQHHQGQISKALYIYMCGGDLETNAGRASDDITELVSNSPSDTTIILQTGGANRWRDHDIDASRLQRWLVTENGLQLIESIDLANMATAKTFSQFLDFATSQYRADKMSLLLWGHGDGQSACSDQLYHYDTLDTREIRSALNTLADDLRFETVIFDACYAATLDIAIAVSDHSQYMVASVKELPGTGLNYSVIDFTAAGLGFAKSLSNSLISDLPDEAGPEMVVIKLSEIPRLLEYVEDLDLVGSEQFAIYESNDFFLVDFSDVLFLLPNNEQEILQSLVLKCVVYNTNPSTQTSGLSVLISSS